jgi:hypothetical protein
MPDEDTEEEAPECADCGQDPCNCCDICGENADGCECCHDCNHMHCICCSACGSTYGCDECYNCGYQNCECECCPECENSPCVCNSIHSLNWGGSDLVPVGFFTDNNVWKKEWPVLAEKADSSHPVTLAANFYLLEAMIAGVGLDSALPKTISYDEFAELFSAYSSTVNLKRLHAERDNKPVSVLHRIRFDAELAMKGLVNDWYEPIFEYMMMAIGGELRHHRAVQDTTPLNAGRRGCWAIYKRIVDHLGVNEAMAQAYDVFLDFTSDGYGGALWADGAKVVSQAHQGILGPNEFMNRKMFLDRVWTLEHNGGCFLNKIEWNNAHGWHLMKVVLNAHGSHPFPHFGTLFKYASPKIAEIGKLYVAAVNVVREQENSEPIPTDFDATCDDISLSKVPSVPYHPLTAPRSLPDKVEVELSGAMRIFIDLLQKQGAYV